MKHYQACLSFKFKDSFDKASILKANFEKEGISCYFDYDDQTEIIENGLNAATEIVYGLNSDFKIVLLSENYFCENSIPYMEWNAMDNSLSDVNNASDYLLVCSDNSFELNLKGNFKLFNYSNIEKLSKELIWYIKNFQTSYRYSQYNLNHIQHTNEIEAISNLIFKNNKSIFISAPSGAGKTEFIKSLIRFYAYKNDFSIPVIYYDFSSDSFKQEMAIKTILSVCATKKTTVDDLPFNLLVEDTLHYFAKENKEFSTAISDFSDPYIDKCYFAEMLYEYFKWLLQKRGKLIIIFDNLQRCSDVKNDLLIYQLSKIKNIQFAFISSSTEEMFHVDTIIGKFNQTIQNVNLPTFCKDDLNKIIIAKAKFIKTEYIERIIALSMIKDYYNLKIIDILTCFYKEFKAKALGLQAADALKQLTGKQRELLMLLYVANGQISNLIACRIFNFKANDVNFLEKLRCVNVVENKIVFAHDTISYFIKQISNNLNEFCKNAQMKIIKYLTDESIKIEEETKLELMETYSRMVNISRGSWFNALGIFAEYIKLLSIKQAYHTIIEIKESFESADFDPFENLSSETMGYLLEAYLKTAKIKKGLETVDSLHSKSKNIVRLESKLMIQDYKYSSAISKLNSEINIRFDPELAMMLCNALAHKRYDNKILEVIGKFDSQSKESDYYYIILRNTGHLYDVDKAIDNLKKARSHFYERRFEFATCTNNLGLQYLRKYSISSETEILNKAEQYFKSAKKIFESLGESEMYQATFNLSLIESYKGNYEQAIRCIDDALTTVSNDLLFDIHKFSVTKNCLNLLSGAITAENCIENLRILQNNCDVDFAGSDIDPWLLYQVSYNIAVIENAIKGRKTPIVAREFSQTFFKDEEGKNYCYTDNYGAYIPCVIKNRNVFLLFATSPHWRY